MRWLDDNDSIPDILKKCVDMIPERYFYGSDIDSVFYSICSWSYRLSACMFIF